MSESKTKTIYKILVLDIKLGIIMRWYWYVPIFLSALFLIYTSNIQAGNVLLNSTETLHFSFLDYLILSTKGIPPFESGDAENFILPSFWFVNNIYIVFVNVIYAYESCVKPKFCFLLNSKSLNIWWGCKFFYVLYGVGISVFIQWCVFLIFALQSKINLFSINSEILHTVFKLSRARNLMQEFWAFYLLLLPLCVSCVLTIATLVLSLIVGFKYGFIVITAYIGTSAFVYNLLFFPSVSMLERTDFILPDGYSAFKLLQVLFVMTIILFYIGNKLFVKRDFVSNLI